LAFWDGKNTDAFYFNVMRDASGDYTPFQKHGRLKWFGAPLYQQAFRWFREKHSLFHVITIKDLGKYEDGNPDFQCAIYSKDPVLITNMDKYNTYEEAEQACIDKLIEICKNK
jgi:hypothetical protein